MDAWNMIFLFPFLGLISAPFSGAKLLGSWNKNPIIQKEPNQNTSPSSDRETHISSENLATTDAISPDDLCV